MAAPLIVPNKILGGIKMNNSENFCPCCGRHCSVENLHCPRGKAHFGIETDGEQSSHHHISGNMTNDEKVIALMRGCGHFLHHNMHGNTDNLLSALSENEKTELISILEKCLTSWENI
jgi:hypothetical protein